MFASILFLTKYAAQSNTRVVGVQREDMGYPSVDRRLHMLPSTESRRYRVWDRWAAGRLWQSHKVKVWISCRTRPWLQTARLLWDTVGSATSSSCPRLWDPVRCRHRIRCVRGTLPQSGEAGTCPAWVWGRIGDPLKYFRNPVHMLPEVATKTDDVIYVDKACYPPGDLAA